MIIEVLTGVLVVVTTCYVYLTYRILRENSNMVREIRNQTEQMSRPYVICRLTERQGTGLIQLEIKNSGRTAAKDVQLELDRSVPLFGDPVNEPDMRTFSAFSVPIDMLAPDQSLLFNLGMGHRILKEESEFPSQFVVTARYKYNLKTVSEKHEIDLKPLSEASSEPHPVGGPTEAANKTLKQIHRELGAIALHQRASASQGARDTKT